MNTRRLVTNAALVALYVVLSLFVANMGFIKLTFESFAVLVSALMFGWVDGLAVGALGGLINQLVTYGLSVTTLLWMLPNMARGAIVGLYAKRHNFDLTTRQTAMIVLLSSLVVTTLNTLILWLDGIIYHYPVAFTLGTIGLRYLNSIIMAVIYTIVTPKTVKILRRANMWKPNSGGGPRA